MGALTTKAITLLILLRSATATFHIAISVVRPRYKSNSWRILSKLSSTVGDASGATRLAHNVYESDLMADFFVQIKMPSGYFFGVSAASADTPDSFEIYKFVTSSAPGVTRELPKRESPPQQSPPAANPGGQTTDQGTQQASSNAQLAVQFTELQNRLSTLSQSLDNVFREVQSLSAKSDARHQDLTKRVSFNEQLNTMDQKVQSIENTLRDYSGQFSSIRGVLKDSHSTLNEGLTQQMTHSECLSPKRTETKLTSAQSYRQNRPG